MKRFESMRDRLRSGELSLEYLDAAQLVKHAFGLVTMARRKKCAPALFYIFAEPAERAGKPIDSEAIRTHREEALLFQGEVAGDEVRFGFSSYRDWLNCWNGEATDLGEHRDAIVERFAP